MIEVRHLSKTYDEKEVVKDVSFKVEAGEVMILLGTSGSGKTTCLKMINKLVERTAGVVLLHAKNTDDFTPHQLRRRMGYVIQNIGLFPHYTIQQNIAVVPHLLGWPKAKIDQRVTELLSMMNLPQEIKERKAHELSGGQQQRAGIARALAADPDVILLDEPFGALDPITRSELQQEFKKLEGGLKKAMILVTHDVVEAATLGNKICLLDKGVIQQIGTPKALLFQPRNTFVKQFFSQQRIQLEFNVITLADLQRVANISISGDPGHSLFEHSEKHNDQKVFQLYFKNRERIINSINGSD